jgi:hypothetical protein
MKKEPTKENTMKQTSLWKRALAVTLTVLAVAAGAWPVSAVGQATNTVAAVDPAAITALGNMGAYLRTLKAFQIEAAIQREDVLDDGLKAQFQGVVNMVARRPDRLRVDASSDRQERQYLYDGKQFTLWARRMNNYATVPAPPSIGELVDVLEKKFGIEMPLVDLFRWGTEADARADITAAVDIGPSKIGGADCRHYALRQEGLDWHIWIQTGDCPLPRKLVITTTTDEARPQFQATYTWNLAPTVNDADFTFEPPAGVNRIVFDETAPEAGAGKEEK